MPTTKCMQCAKAISIKQLAAHSLICLKVILFMSQILKSEK